MRVPIAFVYCLTLSLVLLGCSMQAPPTPSERLEAAGRQAVEILSEIEQEERAMQFNKALLLADSLIKVAPDLPDGHYHKGYILLKLYQLESADESLADAAELDRYHRGAWYQRGHVALEQGQYREAIRRYLKQKEVILASPPTLRDYYGDADKTALSQAWLQVGRGYQILNVADSATLGYEQALEMDSTNAQAFAWLSEIYDEEGDTGRALQMAQRALTIDRTSPDFAYKVGTLLLKTGKPGEALPYLEWGASVEPWHQGMRYNLGRVLMALGRIEEANRHLEITDYLQELDAEIDQAKAAAARFPNDPDRWRTVAAVLARAGRRAEQYEALAIAAAVANRAGAESTVEEE